MFMRCIIYSACTCKVVKHMYSIDVCVITCVDAAVDSGTQRLVCDMTTDISTDIDNLPADSTDVQQPLTVTVTTDYTVHCQPTDLPADCNSPVHDSPVPDLPLHDSSIHDSSVHDLPAHESPVHDLPRDFADSDDGVKHESDSGSHGNSSNVNDSDGVIVTGSQGDLDNDVVAGLRDPEGQGESDVQTTTEELENESESSSQGDFSQFQCDSELNVDMTPQPGHHGDDDLDLVTSQPMTSRHVEESEETLDDGTVVRRLVTTTQEVGK